MKKQPSLFAIFFACFVMLGLYAPQASAEGTRVRGELTSLEQGVAIIENSAGQRVRVTMKENYAVLLYKDISLAEIPADAYISIPSVPLGEGKIRALGINVFPEAMRGFNEGFSDWDLGSGSKMTNATLAKVVSTQDGKGLLVRFGESSQEVVVAENTPITTFDVAPDYALKTGQLVVVFTSGKGTGSVGKFIGVRENGELPPI